MKQPEVEARNGVVVARIAQVQESQQLFVDEEEPEKAVILARNAVQREVEIRRITQRRQNMPGHRDEQNDQRSRERMQALPGPRRKTAAA